MAGPLPLSSHTFSYCVSRAVSKNQIKLVSKTVSVVVKFLNNKYKSFIALLLIGMEDSEIALNTSKQSLFY